MQNYSHSVKKPFFIDTGKGNIFALYLHPQQNSQEEIVVFIPPFAEEMNKTRHMMFLLGDAIVNYGKSVSIFDYYGTGDSQGKFEDCSLSIWIDNTSQILQWAASEGYKLVTFVAVRLGTLLLSKYLSESSVLPLKINKIVFWQPVLDGAIYIKQFIRIKQAADFIGSGDKLSVAAMLEEMQKGACIDIAGYNLSSRLFTEISGLKMVDFISEFRQQICWFEIIASNDRPIGIATRKILENEQWFENPLINKVVGEQFWATPEISINKQLIQQTANYIGKDG